MYKPLKREPILEYFSDDGSSSSGTSEGEKRDKEDFSDDFNEHGVCDDSEGSKYDEDSNPDEEEGYSSNSDSLGQPRDYYPGRSLSSRQPSDFIRKYSYLLPPLP